MRSIITIIILNIVLVSGVSVQAAPLYYTVEGTVTNINDPNNDAALLGIEVGSHIQHTFLVDFDLGGYIELINGNLEYEEDAHAVGGNITYDFDIFYVDYVSGTPLVNKPYDIDYLEYNKGQIAQYTNNTTGEITPGLNLLFGSNLVDVGTHSSYVYDWAVGEKLFLYDRWESQNYIEGSVVITSISTMAPVPVPPSVILFLSGFIAIFASDIKNRLTRAATRI